MRYLIVNADDFGLSAETNRGIAIAHERGIVTSASVMVREAAARDAFAYAREHGALDLGLHVDLGEWRYRDGEWLPLYHVVDVADERAVSAEVRRQLESFLAMRGAPPTHIDTHQHVHQRSPAKEVLAATADALRIPLRHAAPGIRYCGDFYGQSAEGWPVQEAITTDALVSIVRNLGPGVTELACHPGFDETLDTTYRAERAQEVRALCDPRVKEALAASRVVLTGFSRLPYGAPGPASCA